MVFICPGDQAFHGDENGASQLRQFVFDTRRDFRIDSATDEAVLFQPPQGAGKHLFGDVADFARKRIEAHRPAFQRFQNKQAPLIADTIKNVPDRTGLLEYKRLIGNVAVGHVDSMV